MRKKLEESDGLINLRFYMGISEAFSEEFRNSLSRQEMMDMQMSQADPFYKLDKEFEEMLEVEKVKDF